MGNGRASPLKNVNAAKNAKKTNAKKALGGAKKKPAARVAAKVAGDHWFAKLSKKGQAEYIKLHPNSKFAKGAKVKAVEKSAKKDHGKAFIEQGVQQFKESRKEVLKASRESAKAYRKHSKHRQQATTLAWQHSNERDPKQKKKLHTKLKAVRAKQREAKAVVKEKDAHYKKLRKAHKPLVKQFGPLNVKKTLAKMQKAAGAKPGKKAPGKVGPKTATAKIATRGTIKTVKVDPKAKKPVAKKATAAKKPSATIKKPTAKIVSKPGVKKRTIVAPVGTSPRLKPRAQSKWTR
jgi:hypothetical protein